MNLLSWTFAVCFVYLTNLLIPTENINNISGAWIAKSGSANNLLVLQDGYLSLTKYDERAKKFFYTKGGRYKVDDSTLSLTCEFNSSDKEDVGKTLQYTLSMKDKELVLTEAGQTPLFIRPFILQLSFNGEIKGGLWYHSGLSSKGDPINETWERYR